MEQAVKETGKALHDQAPPSWRWKGHNTLIVDGTTVLMPDTTDNQQAFPQPSTQKPGLGFPMARAGVMNKKVPRQISFMTAVQLFNEIKGQLISLTGEILQHLIKGTLEAMGLIGIGKQKRKNQPRAIKRRPKAYPRLTIPRAEACKSINQGVMS